MTRIAAVKTRENVITRQNNTDYFYIIAKLLYKYCKASVEIHCDCEISDERTDRQVRRTITIGDRMTNRRANFSPYVVPA